LAGNPGRPRRRRSKIVETRRELGLSLKGAEASLERMLAEPPPSGRRSCSFAAASCAAAFAHAIA
jgi:hypothetical protein